MPTRNTDKRLSLTHKWKRWIAESRMLGVPDDRIIHILATNGIEETLGSEEVVKVVSHPYYQAGQWIAQRLRKLESLLSVYAELSQLLPTSGAVERREAVSNLEFVERYYSANRPVILINIMSDWKAIKVWDPQYLKTVCGNQVIEVMTERDSDPLYELNSESHKTTMTFSAFLEIVASSGESNNSYMVANNRFMDTRGARPLFDDMKVFPEYLDQGRIAGHVFLWLGSAGTVTPLHHDTMNIFIAQVRGRKRIGLISPNYTHQVYNEIGVYSQVDYESPDFKRHPLFKNVECLAVDLAPGEVLFVPVGWWHYVRSLDVSITVSFTNFVSPNNYRWQNPRIER